MSELWRGHWGLWIKARIKFLGYKVHDVYPAIGVAQRTFTGHLAQAEMPKLKPIIINKLSNILSIHSGQLPHVHVNNEPTEDRFIVASAKVVGLADAESARGSMDYTTRENTQLSDDDIRRQINGFALVLDGTRLYSVHRYVVQQIENIIKGEPIPHEVSEKHPQLKSNKIAAKLAQKTHVMKRKP